MKTNVTSGRPPEGAAGVNTRALRCTHKGQVVQVCMPRGGAHTGGAHGALRCTRGGGAARRQHSPPEEVHRPRSGQMCSCISVRGPSAHAPPPVTGQPRWRQEYKGEGEGLAHIPGRGTRPSGPVLASALGSDFYSVLPQWPPHLCKGPSPAGPVTPPHTDPQGTCPKGVPTHPPGAGDGWGQGGCHLGVQPPARTEGVRQARPPAGHPALHPRSC